MITKTRGGIVAEPLDAIRAIHNAFRNDLEHIDAAALPQRGERRILPALSNVSSSSTKY
ncbi:MAG: hypothetical protein ACXV39_11325 [Halobacteriota archaeon]